MAPRLAVVKDVPPAASEGHNSEVGMTADKYAFLRQQITDAEKANAVDKETAKQSKALVTKARKLFQAHGGSLSELDLARELSEMDNPEDARARVSRFLTYLGYEGFTLPNGAVAAVSVDPYAGLPSIERDRAVWKERGKIAAMSGAGVFAGDVPEGTPPDCYQAWADGVHEGYAENAKKLTAAGPLFAAAVDPKPEPDEDGEDEEGED